MAFLGSMNVVGSGLTAQQLRLDVISENITNLNTTRTDAGGAYRRKVVVMKSNDAAGSFANKMNALTGSNRGHETAGGVVVTEIGEDESEMKLVYNPDHPDANEEGYVEMPNVTLVKEVADAMAASQAYSANVTAFNALKAVVSKGMEIGR